MQGYRITKYVECEELGDLQTILERWDDEPLFDQCKDQRELKDRMDIQDLNMRTVKTRLARHEYYLSTIRYLLLFVASSKSIMSL